MTNFSNTSRLAKFDGHSAPAVDRTLEESFAVQVDYDGGSSPVYIGIAYPGNATSDVAWAIRKITYDSGGSITGLTFANGENSFINIWDNRASYSYS